jgi:hypothetical protein
MNESDVLSALKVSGYLAAAHLTETVEIYLGSLFQKIKIQDL